MRHLLQDFQSVSEHFTTLRSKGLITFLKKIQKQPPEVQKQSPERFCKSAFFKNFVNFTGKHLSWSLFFLIKLQAFSLKTPTQVLSCEVWVTFRNTYFEEHLQATASGGILWKSCSLKLRNIHRTKVASYKVFYEKGVFSGW